MSEPIAYTKLMTYRALEYDGTAESWEAIREFLFLYESECSPGSSSEHGIWYMGGLSVVEPGQWVSNQSDWSIHDSKPVSA